MPFVIVPLILFACLMAANADAKTDAELLALAKKFSPVLILTEETGHKWGDIIVTKPEPVGIMGATSADNIQFDIYAHDLTGQLTKIASAPLSDETWFDPSDVKSNEETWDSGQKRIKLLENKFAFFNGLGDLTFTATVGSDNMVPGETYTLKDAHFDFSGTGTAGWNTEYKAIGENFPNTAYVHVYDKILAEYEDSLTVIQYHYFYPYNDWWNNHEGDWQRIDVVIDSSEEEVIGVEYRFHSAHLSYYKDYKSPQGPNPFSSAKMSSHAPEFCCVPSAGLTNSFIFNPQTDLKLSQGTHPVVYVGAGSHAAYPVGGKIKIYHEGLELLPGLLTGLSEAEDEVQGAAGGDYEYMTHMGLVLSTQADGTHRNLWESYDLVVLPEPDLTDTNNMGLDPAISWLGAQIRWGTPQVSGPIFSEGDGNESPKRGPYNSETDDWEDLRVFHKGHTGPGAIPLGLTQVSFE